MSKRLWSVGITALALLAGGPNIVSFARAQSDCQDRVTGGGFITPGGQHANFGAHGGQLHEDLEGNLNYADHNPSASVRHVTAQTVVAYCRGCTQESLNCRRITYSPATVDGVEVPTVTIEVCDNGEPGTGDTFAICIPSRGYCQSGVLGGDDKPSGGNIQLHVSDPPCVIPVCQGEIRVETPRQCACFPGCPF
jgi:hypothetical protein